MVVQKQRKPGEVFWPKVVLKKWLNISSKDSEFSADEDDGDESELDEEDCGCEGGDARRRIDGVEVADENLESAPYKLRRRNSETLRAQYINTKELRISIGTWNAGGKIPPDQLNIAEWLGVGGEEEPADIYVLGFQEIVPLNAGNVLGAEDSRPVQAWENLIRGALNRTRPAKPRYKCYSVPPSPSRFDPSEDCVANVDELILGSTDSDSDDDDGGDTFSFPVTPEALVAAAPKKLTRLNHFTLVTDQDNEHELELEQPSAEQRTLVRSLSKAERIGLVWPEQPLDLLAKHSLNNSGSFKSSTSFRTYRSFVPGRPRNADQDELVMIPDLDLDAAARRRRRSPYVRIISKQMVGIFLTIWVRRGLRKCIHNLKVSTVGVGAMGYIGNKGSVSVSMSIYQTMFCFVCSHLSSGEKAGDVHKRNADVQEIYRRTRFTAADGLGLPKDIYDHERIFWLGDLNYRIDLSSERTHELISTMDWSQLAEKDQLKRELKKGRAFDGWTEGVLTFPPTYKYERNSGKYIRDDQKGGRRTPAWCDRILSFGRGVKLASYKRAELTLSDHRPVAAVFAAEVEEFCSRKLQRALTLTDAEIEGGQVMPDIDFGFGVALSS